MVVGDDDRGDRPPGDGGEQRLHMRGLVGTGVDHRQIGAADEVRLRTGIGEWRRVGREDPSNERFELDGNAGGLLGHAGQMAVGAAKRNRRPAASPLTAAAWCAGKGIGGI